jgi:hypothetical protein
MTPELISSIAGILLSLMFSYIPGVNAWYENLEGTYKRLIMLGLLFMVAAGIFGLGCANLISDVACTKEDALRMLQVFITALIANQTTFLVSPKVDYASKKNYSTRAQ